MTVHVVQLGSARGRNEGLRIGTVRRPPRGVPKDQYAARDFYDVWLPDLAPSDALLKSARSAAHDERSRGRPAEALDERSWKAFARHYRAEMARPEARRLLDLLAALSHTSDFAVGCYCADESRCHRSLLRELLRARGAKLA